MTKPTYRDGRFWQGDAPYFLLASDYMHFRDRRDNWADRLQKIKDSGANTVTSYICWRHHLRVEGTNRWYDFTGRTKDSRDLVHYLSLVQRSGLYLILKPGPFIHSETNVGGLPDLVSPTFNKEMPAARRHHGRPARWTYDNSILPSAFDPTFDGLCKEWLQQVREIIVPYATDDGPLIALQLNDETLYCTSNDPPWQIGYEPAGMAYYHGLLAKRYGDIENYNRLHSTSYPAFEFVPGPTLDQLSDPARKSPPGPRRREDLLRYIDWAEYQWRLRRDLYLRYADYLNIELPLLTNYAGITPPIEENVPDLQDEAKEPLPPDHARQYPEWWFAMNRVDQDADRCHYGMISWLGVAAYDRGVFDRYMNTSRRARGINMEENWGFGTLYDHRSRDPIVPFFQTLASVAGGATGYVVFVTCGSSYWDETLDRITKLQCNSFPSHAPVDEDGNIRPMYYTCQMLNRWFAEHGQAFLRCQLDVDSAYLLYAPYAAVSSWVPDERYWGLAPHGIPRCGRHGFEEFSTALQEAGYSFSMYELEAASLERMQSSRSVAIHSAFFMDEAAQSRLAEFVRAGGRLFISGELPTVDLQWQPCTTLRDAIAASPGNVTHQSTNLFAEGKFADHLASAGIQPQVTYSQDMRAYVYRGENETFVFFFNFDVDGEHDKVVEFYGRRLELRLGSKTCGVVRITGDKLTGYMVKGENEVEKIRSRVRIALGDQVVEGTGDFSSVA
jgi:beta-galactosidase